MCSQYQKREKKTIFPKNKEKDCAYIYQRFTKLVAAIEKEKRDDAIS